MARARNPYSRMVAWLKILLPLIALAVLGTVFLFNSQDRFEAGFTFSTADIATLESGSFISQPRIEGMTRNGEPFYLNAARIAPEDGDMNLVVVSALAGEFRFPSGGWVKIRAETALMDVAAQTVRLDSGGEIDSSDGTVARVDRLLVRLDSGEISGSGILANGPLGRISADDFRFRAGEGENRVLWFENNVRMRYDLQNASE